MYKVFIGTEDAQWLPTEVLKYSITSRSQEDYAFKELKNIPLKLKIKMYTGFSFYRFAIPEICHYQDRALYLDADMVVQCNLKELFEIEMGENGVLSRPHHKEVSYFTSVMLMACDRLKQWKINQWATLINADIAPYDATMMARPSGLCHQEFGPLEPQWNDLDRWSEQTKILHYTHVPSQPWKKPGHPFAFVFLKEMQATLNKHLITIEEVKKEIDKGHVYADILQDAKNSL